MKKIIFILALLLACGHAWAGPPGSPPVSPGVGTGDMLTTNNLSDLTSAATARTNLGVEIGTDVLAPTGDGSGLDLSTPPAIGGTTPAAVTGTTVTGSTLTDGTCTVTGGALDVGCDVSSATGLPSSTQVNDELGASFDTEAEQAANGYYRTTSAADDAGSIDPNSGSGANYGMVVIDWSPASNPSGITLGETNAANDNLVILYNADSTNSGTLAYAANNFENNCGAGTTTTLAPGDSIILKYVGTTPAGKWKLIVDNTHTPCFASINLESGTITGGVKTVQVTAATYAMGTDSADSWGSVILNYDDDALAVTMETAVAGQSFCVRNAYGVTGALTLTPASSDYLMDGGFGDGVRGTAATAYTSSGAAGDEICVYCEDATNCSIRKEVGTWSE